MAVFRDMNAFKDDVRNGRIRSPFGGNVAEQESRCEVLALLKNLPMDIIFNRFFKLSELKKYKLIFIPSDPVFTDEYALELIEYVKQGGCVISEGATANNSIFAKLAGVTKIGKTKKTANIMNIPMIAPISVRKKTAKIIVRDAKDNPAIYINKYGKGKVIYTNYILTDDLNNSLEKELLVRKLIAKLIGPGPIIPDGDTKVRYDSSLLVNGNEYFFGVYNSSFTKMLDTKIKLDIPFSDNYKVLNVNTGETVPFKGSVNVSISPSMTGFYLIGGKILTNLPDHTKAINTGGCSRQPGMFFFQKRSNFGFRFAPEGEPKVIGVLHIHDKRGRQSQTWGAEAIFH